MCIAIVWVNRDQFEKERARVRKKYARWAAKILPGRKQGLKEKEKEEGLIVAKEVEDAKQKAYRDRIRRSCEKALEGFKGCDSPTLPLYE